MGPIIVTTLGSFSLQAGENKISDSDNRSKKVWLLLTYLLCHRGRPISQKALISLLWGDEPSSSNPENALKITFHRVRSLLDRLWPNAGRELIVHQEGGYCWNPNVPMVVDADEFERLCRRKTEDREAQLNTCLEALALYKGSFLEKLSSEAWVIPMATHLHNQYIETVLAAVPLLSAENQHQKAIAICRAASQIEPYHEPLHQLLIRALAATGDAEGASTVYKELSQRLFNDFGIRPTVETRQVYRAATQTLSDRSLPMDVVLEHLQEKDSPAGAMQCDYDYFKILCHAEVRSMERSGKATHIALLSVASRTGTPLSSRSLDLATAHLGEQIRTNLRRGDIFSRCSVSQYIIMLPQANYENSCMVCRRVIGAFSRKHPHSPARINFIVQPLGHTSLEL